MEKNKGKYTVHELIEKIKYKYSKSEFLNDPMYIALTEKAKRAEHLRNENSYLKEKIKRLQTETYDEDIDEHY